jgi:glycosyltransferase involved in cell wall biosynthesis
MRVIIFSWEYPPRVVGQLSEYTSNLATALAKNKVDTYVVTYHDSQTGTVEEANGVKTTRVANPVKTHAGVLTWDLTLNQEVERAASNIYYESNKQVDLINVCDWHFIPAAVTIKNGLGIPFVFSVESLEDHRTATNAPYNMAIKSIEWLGFYEAEGVCVRSEWMKKEVARIYKVPEEKITVISNPQTNGWIKSVLKVYRSISEEKNSE